MFNKKMTKSALESLMFIWGEPLDAKDAAEACGITKEEAIECFLELQQEYDQEGRGLLIRRINNSFQYATRPDNADFIERLCTPVKTRRLSQAALEVLAIVAYKQPVTKSEIDSIRGIKCDRVIEGLAAKDLVCEKGRSEGIGRPILYGTTETFLKHFGFSSIKELPVIEDLESVLAMDDAEVERMDMQISIEEMEFALEADARGEELPLGDLLAEAEETAETEAVEQEPAAEPEVEKPSETGAAETESTIIEAPTEE